MQQPSSVTQQTHSVQAVYGLCRRPAAQRVESIEEAIMRLFVHRNVIITPHKLHHFLQIATG